MEETTDCINEVTVDCEGAASLLAGELLNHVQMLSVFACKRPDEEPVDVENCLDIYKNLAYQLLTLGGLNGYVWLRR